MSSVALVIKSLGAIPPNVQLYKGQFDAAQDLQAEF
jgi:hypothetical protein